LNGPLKIAFVTYEYPPDTSGGGIGTYTQQVAKILETYGHPVTVFCGTPHDDHETISGSIRIIRIRSSSSEEFREKVVLKFKEENSRNAFDVMESPEFGACGYFVRKACPTLPYIVNLHTPSYILNEFNDYFRQYLLPGKKILRLKTWARKIMGIRHYPFYKKEDDIEYKNLLLADHIISPSAALAKKIRRDWKLSSSITVQPNPYFPSQDLLEIPIDLKNRRITFIGRLSILKGLLSWPDIIFEVLKSMPDLKFRFIGLDSFSPENGLSMKEFVKKKCSSLLSNIEFTGPVALDKIPGYLAQTDILVCNSLWENYPTVLLEGMSAGRVVIGTNAGGIPEIIRPEENGIIVSVNDASVLALKILWVYNNPSKAKLMAEAGRRQMMNIDPGKTYADILSKYLVAIEKCKSH
jgi:glycogen(starch) synthase